LDQTLGAIKPKALLFDLLTALMDSWSLWDSVAGSFHDGRRWRAAYLKNTYSEGRYRSYEVIVGEAADAVGLSSDLADRLVERYSELAPWPEVAEVLGSLQQCLPLGVVTNCSERLGQLAAARTGINFVTIVTAERAGYYKPHPRPYQLALSELNVEPQDCLFIAGSAYDLYGADAVGLRVFWHDRIGMTMPPSAPPPLVRHDRLTPLQALARR
jgi:2-haloalkanoic acid dehalogenase type II